MKGQCIKQNTPLEANTEKIKPGANPNFVMSSNLLAQSSFNCLKKNLHDEMIPFHVAQLCRFINQYGGLPGNVDLDDVFIEGDLEKELNVSDEALESTSDISSATRSLKIFLERLPEPLIPKSVCNIFFHDMKSCNQKSGEFVQLLKLLVVQLPVFSFSVLKYLSNFLHQTARNSDNSLSFASLGIVFGPIIFRLTEVDPHVNITKKAMQLFASDYHAIFVSENEDGQNITYNSTRTLPIPSTIMPVVAMEPLSVVIPLSEEPTETEDHKTNSLIEKQLEKMNLHLPEEATVKNAIFGSLWNTRKRKESDESIADKYSENFANSNLDDFSLQSRAANLGIIKPEEFKRKQSDNYLTDGKCIPLKQMESKETLPTPISLNHVGCPNSVSPHPPDPKRREIESADYRQLSENDVHVSRHEDMSAGWCFIQWDDLANNKKTLSNNFTEAGCLAQERAISVNSDSMSSWDLLFDAEEPVRSECRLISPMLETEDQLLSPSVYSLRKSNSQEAPLSPSAFKQYLSHRSSHGDPSVPPSPPIEQEHFDRSPEKEVAVSVKQLSKKIHVVKKKLKNFDVQYEKQYGYQPSHAEKMNFTESKKLLCQLHKARKRLKILREDTQLNSFENCQPSDDAHILEDTTNCLKEGYKMNLKYAKPSINSSWGDTLKGLNHERKLANRPEDIEDMTKSQVEDEKLAIQNALLGFERIHGKPLKSEDRNTIRPLYERYRNVKRLLAKCAAFPISCSKPLNSPGLQPIMEHEAMDFSALLAEKQDCEEYLDAVNSIVDDSDLLDVPENVEKYDNSNLHELPLSEMIIQQQEARIEKRRLRRTLKDFEMDFLKLNGRVVQKEDKAPVDFLYSEYKIVKARVRLLEALISKHYEHNF